MYNELKGRGGKRAGFTHKTLDVYNFFLNRRLAVTFKIMIFVDFR